MSSILSSQTVVLATAMAVSGTVILLTICRHKPSQFTTMNQNPDQILRSCISSDGRSKRDKKKKKKKKKVHFAEDVVDPISGRDGEVFRRECRKFNQVCGGESQKAAERIIPANRMALYNGILRDRVHRTTCSY